jgi:hypothetical protein
MATAAEEQAELLLFKLRKVPTHILEMLQWETLGVSDEAYEFLKEALEQRGARSVA